MGVRQRTKVLGNVMILRGDYHEDQLWLPFIDAVCDPLYQHNNIVFRLHDWRIGRYHDEQLSFDLGVHRITRVAATEPRPDLPSFDVIMSLKQYHDGGFIGTIIENSAGRVVIGFDRDETISNDYTMTVFCADPDDLAILRMVL